MLMNPLLHFALSSQQDGASDQVVRGPTVFVDRKSGRGVEVGLDRVGLVGRCSFLPCTLVLSIVSIDTHPSHHDMRFGQPSFLARCVICTSIPVCPARLSSSSLWGLVNLHSVSGTSKVAFHCFTTLFCLSFRKAVIGRIWLLFRVVRGPVDDPVFHRVCRSYEYVLPFLLF